MNNKGKGMKEIKEVNNETKSHRTQKTSCQAKREEKFQNSKKENAQDDIHTTGQEQLGQAS